LFIKTQLFGVYKRKQSVKLKTPTGKYQMILGTIKMPSGSSCHTQKLRKVFNVFHIGQLGAKVIENPILVFE